ncbi:MAG: RloB family protein, partial [bacterium]|nr:RloB family protein [bacterium]
MIRVLTEGEVTEPDYLDLWRRQNSSVVVDIDTATAGHAPLSLVQEARKMKRSQRRRDPEFDEIWCVFDGGVVAHRPAISPDCRHPYLVPPVHSPPRRISTFSSRFEVGLVKAGPRYEGVTVTLLKIVAAVDAVH